MSTELIAFIEYDRAPIEYEPSSAVPLPPPFAGDSGEPQSVSEKGGINTGSKDYPFFGAIAGVRNQSGIPPLIPPRDLPQNLSTQTRQCLDSRGRLGSFGDSWLTFGEVQAALRHQNINPGSLCFETQTILAIMQSLAQRLGPDHVRIVFGFAG